MDDKISERFEQLIAQRTGLKLRDHQRESLDATLVGRMSELGLANLGAYHDLLKSDSLGAAAEWDRVVQSLTNSESYFFRDMGQIALLRDRILPELLERNASERKLRVWSAGCSTGEEPYTLAMIIGQLIAHQASATGDDRPWQVRVLGTDIDERSLSRARTGIYGSWSFRTSDSATRQSHFEAHEDSWHVKPNTRAMVSFAKCNLVADEIPNDRLGIYDMDLILCRNVFIYFVPEAIANVLPKFAKTLRLGGYLMTGHGETRGSSVHGLETRSFAESDVFQRPLERLPTSTPQPDSLSISPPSKPLARTTPETTDRTTAPNVNPPARQTVIASTRHTRPKNVLVPPEPGPPFSALNPTLPSASVQAVLASAQKDADAGNYEKAIESCEQLIRESPFVSEAYELLAAIAQEQGRLSDAIMMLKKALYLSPESPRLYIALGEIYSREGDKARAQRMRSNALELLQGMRGEAVEACIEHLQALAQEGA